MDNRLLLANLAPEDDEETLRALLGKQGEVRSIEFFSESHSGQMFYYALVEMASEKVSTRVLHGLNGHRLGDRSLTISHAMPQLDKPLLGKQRKVVEEIVTALGESDEKPLRQIETMIMLCSTSFAQTILKDAQELHAREGLMTLKGQPRTLGGVFFYLARFRMSTPNRKIVYTRKGKLPTNTLSGEGEDDAPQPQHAGTGA